uniref:4-hydroxy-tetrahydrodipicolinate synthase n=1 Tax=Oryza nivara TaxID=4536 RepID=A0A0E0GY66_ORYNI
MASLLIASTGGAHRLAWKDAAALGPAPRLARPWPAAVAAPAPLLRISRGKFALQAITLDDYLPMRSTEVKNRTSTADITSLRVITAVKTPYLPDGRFDLEAYDSLINMQIDGGAEGVIVGGTTGEGHLMSWDEHIMLIGHTVNCFGAKVKVVGNTGSNSTREAIHATEQGFAVGVKECVGHERVKCYTDKGITIWSGNDDECHDSRWKYGATGVISVASNLIPGLMHDLMYEGENKTLNEKLFPLMKWLFCQPNPIALNTALAQLGVVRPVFRLPYVPLPLEKRVEFVRIVESIGRENFVGENEARVLDDDDFVLVSRY